MANPWPYRTTIDTCVAQRAVQKAACKRAMIYARSEAVYDSAHPVILRPAGVIACEAFMRPSV